MDKKPLRSINNRKLLIYIEIFTDKLSDLMGGKGVICAVWPDENMPIDDHGNRAELVIDGGEQ